MKHSSHRRGRRLMAAAVPLALVVTTVGIVRPAAAFKPYTHIKTGEAAYADAVDDGQVTIGDQSYALDARVVTALRNQPAYYNAGVIGPDGFPDLTMGQSIIHPVDTGRWLKYLLGRAWAAQTDPLYSATDRQQILAFTYGFLTHAAGDTWAHTLVNEFGRGVFPGVGEILTDEEAAAIALRHLLAEGYVGDATPGFDGDPARGPAPNGDTSDDSTPGIAFAAPIRFIYESLVSPDAAGAPSTERGPIIGFFLGLRQSLSDFLTTNPDPIGAALSAFDETRAALDEIQDACNFDELSDVVDCPIALLSAGFNAVIDSAQALFNFTTETLKAAAKLVLNAYVAAWIDDIDDGLVHWGELGLATTKALFDPQARRDLQNEECQFQGDESSQLRADCENGVGIVDVVLDQSDDFINHHLLSMLGAPDIIGDIREALGVLGDELNQLLGPVFAFFNPIEAAVNAVKNFAKDQVKQMLEDRFGIPITQLETLLDHPSTRMDIQSIDLGPLHLELFHATDRAKMDGYLGLGSHAPLQPLGAGEEFEPTQFDAFANTVTTAKMLLLPPKSMDDLLSHQTGHPYHLYGNGNASATDDDFTQNVMTTTLPGAGSDTTEWLQLIDGDHAWRSNSLPVFDRASAGKGNFPLWESCALRTPAFRGLFTDWENGALNFPDLGDPASTDPNDPAAPTSTMTIGSPQFTVGSTTWVGGATALTVHLADDFFSPSQITVDVRVRAGAAVGGSFATMSDGAVVSLAGQPDGPIHIDLVAHDPCRAETSHTVDIVRDTTSPAITITQPATALYDVDQLASIVYSTDDGPYGSGTASTSVTFDGAAATNGQPLDMFLLNAGLHTVVVTATDQIGNTGTSTKVFRVRATAEGLLNALDRAKNLGLITNAGAYSGIRDSLVAARASHLQGKHATEANQLGAALNQMLNKRGKGIDTATADRLIDWTKDLIAARG